MKIFLIRGIEIELTRWWDMSMYRINCYWFYVDFASETYTWLTWKFSWLKKKDFIVDLTVFNWFQLLGTKASNYFKKYLNFLSWKMTIVDLLRKLFHIKKFLKHILWHLLSVKLINQNLIIEGIIFMDWMHVIMFNGWCNWNWRSFYIARLIFIVVGSFAID